MRGQGGGKKVEGRKNLVRLLTFVFERFGEHELANHAAAGAYAFLLSATPALLLVLGLSNTLLAAFPSAREAWTAIVGEIFGSLLASGPPQAFLSRPLGAGAAALALLSLVWAARLFILTVQRGLRVVWGISPLAKPIRDNVLTFALEFAALLLVVLVIGAAEGARFFLDHLAPLLGETVSLASKVLVRAVPGIFLFLYAFLTYRYVPAKGPKVRTAALAALLCLVAYAAIAAVLTFAMDRTRYDLLYGVFGGLVVLLIKVWVFFMVYFHCAEFAYIVERFDALLMARLLRVARAEKAGKMAIGLFSRPEPILRRYGRVFGAGETIFREGEGGREAYYLLKGVVGVYLSEGEGRGDRQVALIGEGELFGEMAELIAEGRTATTKAETDIEVIVMPPELLESLLANDPNTARRMIDLLSQRLREANLRFTAEGAMDPVGDD